MEDEFGYNETIWTEDNFDDTLKADKIILLCIYIPVFVVALVGNILVLVMVCMNKSVRRNVANYFLVNLAVADLLGKSTRSHSYKLLISVLSFSFVYFTTTI